ncbi:Transcription elongation factor spt5 [Taphrina deformans PYCC 5710]|uniref:Transcription elongation factor SPT5 n=1 Tax=Taphrina deformans (strain PYCC 5710 / ATCC 11124 / CBS 356.35 / IMI 108563 / JCM 9778 / NBRC 8474) TaxID=1097556 RepID=R5A1R6_TAPDE|nr:Transcription elongation factor spt5 [Taphrina deformans PYCC 5710]|eukprot:CCX35447.1 Transcription elongation factor spt5 [Taphrina deformans PYCC 5710]
MSSVSGEDAQELQDELKALNADNAGDGRTAIPHATLDDEEDDEEEEDEDALERSVDSNRQPTKLNSGTKHVMDDDDDDDEEDDDDDELDEEEDDAGSRKHGAHRRKIKRRAVDAFIDREAEVDDDEEDAEDDEDEQEIAEGFIENEDVGGLSPNARADDRRHRELDQQQHRLAEADAERMAAQFKERYGRSGGAYRGDLKSVPQRLLLPSVDDPSIWGIRCKPGKEHEIVFNLLRKQAEREGTSAPLLIVSVFTREHLPGYIYIEAQKQKDVIDAMADVVNAYTNRLVLVPVAEMPDLLRVRNKGTTLVPGAFVRIRKNNRRYAGDLGRINDISIDSTEAFVALVPRLDYGSQEELMRKNLARTNDRPPARLFNVADVEKLTNLRLRDRSGDNSYQFNNEDYHDGLLIKSFKIAHLVTEPDEVKPTLEEMQVFSGGDTFDLTTLGQGLKTRQATFTIGDTAEVYAGEQAGVYGIVESISKNIVELRTTDDSRLGTISVPTSGLRKRFSPGHQVRVQSGKHAGETGSVVAVKGGTVTLMTSMAKEEVTVFSRDLGEINEVSETPAISKYEVRDVVELNATEFGCVIKIENVLLQVLMPSGDIRTIKSDSVARSIPPPKFGRTTDRNGNTIQITAPQSTVREVNGKGRKGKVFNLHLHTVFCHNIEITENNGIFVARDRDVEVAGMASGKVDFSKQNPGLRQNVAMAPPSVLPKTMGRDKAIGQTIWIRKGPQKGLMGLVTDTTDTTARIEPHNGLKKISINKDMLGFRLSPDTPLVGYAEFVNSKGWRDQAGMPSREAVDSNRPIWAQAGNRTPSGNTNPASSYGSGARTPAWAGGGSRTPAWSSNAGAATPAWAGSSNKTPAWSGNATPAWNAGSKTPSWSAAGNATPAWQSGGARTPAWQSGAATPGHGGTTTSSWQTGSKTPSWQRNATPRAPSYGQERPREAYGSSDIQNGSDNAIASGVSRGWEEEWASAGAQSQYPTIQTKPSVSGVGSTPAGDAAFINPARMAQMQHSKVYTDAPGYLPPSP